MNNTNVLGHIVGLDEIHKNKLIKELPENINVIDIDKFQTKIYNGAELSLLKQRWEGYNKKIVNGKKRKIEMDQCTIGAKNLDVQIKKNIQKREETKRNIYDTWKKQLSLAINDKIEQCHSGDGGDILFVGFNIFPKDYRIKINLPIPELTNKIIFDSDPHIYASNQIKFYLQNYKQKIIKGTFPVRMLDFTYMTKKYEKFSKYYLKQQYNLVQKGNMLDVIVDLQKREQIELIKREFISSHKFIYVSILHKSTDIIPVNSKMPIEGFADKNDAINSTREKNKRKLIIYTYKISADQFELIDGKFMATKTLYPDEEESLLLT